MGITNPLREFLKLKPFTPWPEEADPFFCWDAHRVKVDGRVMLIVCNAANRFAGVTAMRAADWRKLDRTCVELIRQSMVECGFSEAATEQYLARAGSVEFGRTHGRKAVGCMNRAVDRLLWSECDHDEQFQAFLTHLVNEKDLASCAHHDGYGYALERMVRDMLAHGIVPQSDRLIIDSLGFRNDSAEDDTGATSENAPGGLTDEEAARELDAILAAFDADDAGEFTKSIDNAIAVVTRAMRRERGNDSSRPPAENGLCTVCGAIPRVFLGGVPYCLNCYNEMTERIMGAPHVTNDVSTLAVYGEESIEQFAVERLIMPPIARWTARELVDEDDPRREGGYLGMAVCVDASPIEDQEETLARLWEKAQEAVSRPSTSVHEPAANSRPISNGAHVNGEVRFANDSGWGRIIEDENGRYSIVIDGQRYDGEQFLGLFTGHTAFHLYWQMHEPGDDLPEPWSMRENANSQDDESEDD